MDKEKIECSFPSEFLKFLTKTGFDTYCKSEQDLDKRLYHDLDIDEDVAEEILAVLEKEYNVDVSHFDIKLFFPPEFKGRNQFERIVFWLLPVLERFFFDKDKYKPFTFRMISDAISSGELTNN